MQFFQHAGLEWPVNQSAPHSISKIDFSGLLPREREAAVFLDVLFKPRARSDGKQIMEFLDVNPTVKRVVKAYFEDDFGPPKPDASPWTSRSPTLTGSAVMLVRYEESPGQFVIRRMEILEEARIMGFSDCMWRAGTRVTKMEHLLALSSINGNALCCYHYLLWMLALYSAFGKFYDPSNLKSSASLQIDSLDTQQTEDEDAQAEHNMDAEDSSSSSED